MISILLQNIKKYKEGYILIELIKNGVYLINGENAVSENECSKLQNAVKSAGVSKIPDKDEARENTIAYSILRAHNKSRDPKKLRIKFDCLASHDITYVGIIQTARASGLKNFPVPYAMTNCHNSLCAVGGTINEDDHVFGLSAAKKYGGIFVPANLSVIHSYVREAMAGCGKMILGSDSHTRYGALGTLGIGEGGPEIVKQLLSNTYDVDAPEVVLVYLDNAPKAGVGPHDVAIALVAAVFESGFVKNKILEFTGPGIKNLPVEFRNGIDVMTTETTCLSSIWCTDDKVKEYLSIHGRASDYKKLEPGRIAYYDSMIHIDLSKVECMIALPFHPSNAYTIKELCDNAGDILHKVDEEGKRKFPKVNFNLSGKIKNGNIMVDQGVIAGCAGGLFDNICDAASILEGSSIGDGYFGLDIYPSSQPVNLALTRNGAMTKLMEAGAIIKPAFCGPCFGAGDVPSNNGFSIRHTTRNFPNREGSKPDKGQISSVALMDARSIAATAKFKGKLTAATDVEFTPMDKTYYFDRSVYDKRIYNGFGKADSKEELRFGPGITDWPKMYALEENMLLELACVIHDPVTTTDELIPSGETSSYRSNPLGLAEYTLSRREPAYVGRAKKIQKMEIDRHNGKVPESAVAVLSKICDKPEELLRKTAIGSAVFANKPGDGSAREQAASCQKVLGGYADICYEYATKRYRSNCINWGIVPFTIDKETKFEYEPGDYVFVAGIRDAVASGKEEIPAKIITKNSVDDITLYIKGLTQDEKEIILQGCLINFYAMHLDK